MSWNFNLRLNNLQNEVNQIVVGSVTNPLSSPLDCNSLAINNATNITATTGQNLSLNTSGANSVTINGPVNIPNHPLVITNNTTADSMIVSDTTGDTSVFRIDASGNVGVKVNTSTTLTNDFTVTGNTLITGNETVTGNVTCNQLNYTTLNPPVSSATYTSVNGSGIDISSNNTIETNLVTDQYSTTTIIPSPSTTQVAIQGNQTFYQVLDTSANAINSRGVLYCNRQTPWANGVGAQNMIIESHTPKGDPTTNRFQDFCFRLYQQGLTAVMSMAWEMPTGTASFPGGGLPYNIPFPPVFTWGGIQFNATPVTINTPLATAPNGGGLVIRNNGTGMVNLYTDNTGTLFIQNSSNNGVTWTSPRAL